MNFDKLLQYNLHKSVVFPHINSKLSDIEIEDAISLANKTQLHNEKYKYKEQCSEEDIH